MPEYSLLMLLLTAAVASLVTAVIAIFMSQSRLAVLREENTRLTVELEAERRAHLERQLALEAARRQISDSFSAMAAEALRHNSSEFLKLAQENLKQFHVHAQGELASREKAVEGVVKPIRDALEKTEQQIHLMEKERREAYGSLSKHLETMSETQRLLQGETRNLHTNFVSAASFDVYQNQIERRILLEKKQSVEAEILRLDVKRRSLPKQFTAVDAAVLDRLTKDLARVQFEIDAMQKQVARR